MKTLFTRNVNILLILIEGIFVVMTGQTGTERVNYVILSKHTHTRRMVFVFFNMEPISP